MVLSEVPEADREFLEAQAATLKALGLPEIAAILTEAAANALPASVVHCPYAARDVYNWQAREQSHRRRLNHHNTREPLVTAVALPRLANISDGRLFVRSWARLRHPRLS